MYQLGDIEMVPFPEPVVTAVDAIVKKAALSGVTTRIESQKHWEIARDLFTVWTKFFPHEYAVFIEQQKELTRSQMNKHGSAREKGGAELQHILEMPSRFYALLSGIFPEVNKQLVGTKEFAMKMAKHIPELKIPDKI